MVPHSCLDQRKSAGWSTINACEVVEWRKELAARWQLGQVDQAFDQRNVRTEDGLVNDELVCRPSRVPGRWFLEEVAADTPGLLLHQPTRGVFPSVLATVESRQACQSLAGPNRCAAG